MSKCETCKWNTAGDGWAMCDQCVHDPALKDQYKPFTAADRIRAMTDEELADLLRGLCKNAMDCDECPMHESCPEGSYDLIPWMEWLQSPAESEETP